MMQIQGGEIVAAFLEAAEMRAAFGVISIHNMPILDAIATRNAIRFVPARGEAGAVNMADAFARATGSLGMAITSTGTGAGNAAGALVEALSAGSPVLHITGQVETTLLDRNKGALHETQDQLGMLRSISKAAFRVRATTDLAATLRYAAQIALTPPRGPVSIEIPIDVQWGCVASMPDVTPIPLDTKKLDVNLQSRAAERIAKAGRPLLWTGGGARGAGKEVTKFLELGFGLVTSVNGRGVVPENHPQSLGAYNFSPAVEELYRSSDLMLVCGSRLRTNETLLHKLSLPDPLIIIDADPLASDRTYPCEIFVPGDCSAVLEDLAKRLEGRMRIDPAFAGDLKAARERAEDGLRKAVSPYATLADALAEVLPVGASWVRDITIAGTSWGHRMPCLVHSRQGIHALGGGIGQGLPMAIGAAIASEDTKAAALVGDGGLMLSLGELGTLVQEAANVVLIVMNDAGYGVIRNIQDRDFAGRRAFVDLHTPDFRKLCDALKLNYLRVESAEKFGPVLKQAFSRPGPVLVEVDMEKIGPFAQAFAGPPRKAASL